MMSSLALVLLSLAFSPSAQAADDCTPCPGTIVWKGGRCFCYVKLPPIEPDDLEAFTGGESGSLEGECAAHISADEDGFTPDISLTDNWLGLIPGSDLDICVWGESSTIEDHWESAHP